MKHNIKSIKTFYIAAILLLLFTSCSKNNEKIEQNVTAPESQSKLLLGTSCKITIYDNPTDEAFLQSFERIQEIENEMSIRISTSELSKINDNAGIKPVVVSDDTFDVIKEALAIASLSNGAFDPTVGPLVSAWNIGSDGARVPPQEEIDSLLPLVGYDMVTLNENDKSVYLENEGMMLDLGGIAKGYAADEVAKILASHDVNNAIINLGGNVLTVGTRVDGSKWRIGVQNPELERGGYVMVAHLEDQALVTSGPYERYLEVDGVIYHHILDTNTGYPVVTNLTSASIIADNSFISDALSTAVYSLGLEKGMALIDSIDGIEALFIDDDKNIYTSKGFEENSIPLDLSDDSFKVIEQ